MLFSPIEAAFCILKATPFVALSLLLCTLLFVGKFPVASGSYLKALESTILQIDIFLYKEKENKVVPIIGEDGDIKTYDKNFVLPAKKMSFEGIDVNVPHQYSAYLKSNFGKKSPISLRSKNVYHMKAGAM